MMKNEVVFITGGASGFGECTARKVVAAQGKAVIADLTLDKAQGIAKELAPDCLAVQCNVTVESEVADAVVAAVQHFGKVTGLVTCAGTVGVSNPVEDLDLELYEKVMSLNSTGTLLAIKHAARAMKKNEGPLRGSIVTMSSVGGLTGGFAPIHYTVSKYAVRGMTAQAAAELGEFGIRANCVAPGAVDTPLVRAWLTGDVDKAAQPWMEGTSPIGVNLTKDHVADTIKWLLSSESGGISAQTLQCDQGIVGNGILGKSHPAVRMSEPFFPSELGMQMLQK
eukprot:jgi/Astpho2/2582/Aster-04288